MSFDFTLYWLSIEWHLNFEVDALPWYMPVHRILSRFLSTVRLAVQVGNVVKWRRADTYHTCSRIDTCASSGDG